LEGGGGSGWGGVESGWRVVGASLEGVLVEWFGWWWEWLEGGGGSGWRVVVGVVGECLEGDGGSCWSGGSSGGWMGVVRDDGRCGGRVVLGVGVESGGRSGSCSGGGGLGIRLHCVNRFNPLLMFLISTGDVTSGNVLGR